MVEWRVDLAPGEEIELGLKLLQKPVIITVRDFRENGAQKWSIHERAERFKKHLHLATFIDVEASTADELEDERVIFRAENEGVGLIISMHDFTNDRLRMREMIKAVKTANRYNADIFKLAKQADSQKIFEDLSNKVDLWHNEGLCIAPMAMGKYGKLSRLLYATKYASPLVYAQLSKSHVIGQWSAQDLREFFLPSSVTW